MAVTAYDVVEYPAGVFGQTHPARSAAIARLHGLPAPSPARCRVLELGTADGGNLLPLALAYPNGDFVGVDLAESVIAKGRADCEALGVKNLTLRAADLCDLPDDLGPFDYVIAHGVFSWVPDAVRDGLLDLCRRLLAPYGVAYVSYNTQPGGHLSQMLSEMMRYHVREITDPAEQLLQARGLMRLIHRGTNVPGPLGEVLKEETRRVFQDFGDPVLFHDDLAEQNRRYYFHEFAGLATRRGLQFLAEADYHELANVAFPPDVAALLDEMGRADRIREEQYRDFLCLRRFRQTLLVRADVGVVRSPRAAEVADFFVAAKPMTPEDPDPDLSPGVRVQFDTAKGSRVTLDHPLAKAALLELAARPLVPVPVSAVVAAAAKRLGRSGAEAGTEADFVYSMLLQAFQVGMVHFAVDPPAFATTPSRTPKLWPLARYQLEAGRETVTSLRHTVVRLDTFLTRQLVLACDGTRDRAAILERVLEWASGRPPAPGQPPEPPEQLRSRLGSELESGLNAVAGLALLIE